MGIGKIRKCNHDLAQLLKAVGKCSVPFQSGDTIIYVKATSIRAETVVNGNTVGALIQDIEKRKPSKYPNEIRYGNIVRHFPPEIVLNMAKQIIAWAKIQGKDITYPAK